MEWLDSGEGKDDVAGSVYHGEVKDGVEFSEETICDYGSKDGEEVDQHGECMVNNGGIALGVRQDVVQVQGENGWRQKGIVNEHVIYEKQK